MGSRYNVDELISCPNNHWTPSVPEETLGVRVHHSPTFREIPIFSVSVLGTRKDRSPV